MACAGGKAGPKLRVGVLLGSRANAWHAEPFRWLEPDLEATIVGTGEPRYPTDDLGLPFLALPFCHQRGSWLRRRALGLRYRLSHRATGFELSLDPEPGALGSFDVLLTWELFTDWTRVALEEKARRGVPVGVVVWDNLALHFADDPVRGPRRRRALAGADRFFVAAEGGAAALVLDGVESTRIAMLPPSVDAARFRPGPAPEARRRLGAGSNEVLVLAVARLEAGKGIRHLLDAMALAGVPAATSTAGPGHVASATASASAPRLRLCVVGSGPERTALERRAEALGLDRRASFVGDVAWAEMPELHRAADLFVLPSVPTGDWQEQWGQSLLEAMASGTACVASASGGIPETLGDAGVLVPPGDVVALARAMAQLVDDGGRRAELGGAARKRVERRYAHEVGAGGRSRLIRDLAATRSAPRD